jgi:hypothetical protein
LTVFVASAFRHGYEEEDFYGVLADAPIKTRSRRGLTGVYEIYGQNAAGDYLHIAYRRHKDGEVVLHMRRMDDRERRWYKRNR